MLSNGAVVVLYPAASPADYGSLLHTERTRWKGENRHTEEDTIGIHKIDFLGALALLSLDPGSAAKLRPALARCTSMSVTHIQTPDGP